MSRENKHPLLRYLPMALIAAGFTAFFAFGVDDYLTFEAVSGHHADIRAWAEDNQLLAVAAFMALYAVVVALSIPGGATMTLMAGLVFGTVATTVYVVISATIGAVAVFLAARTAFGDALLAKAGTAIRRMEDGFNENALSYLLFLRLVPVFPFWLVNLAPAFLGVPLRTYVIGTFFGIIPGTFVFASVGSGMGRVIEEGGVPDLSIIFEPRILTPIIGLALLSLLPVVLKKVWRRA